MIRSLSMMLIAFFTTTMANDTTTFEGFNLPANSYLNDAGPSGEFVADGHAFNNLYNPNYDSWYGWSISNTTDTTTPGYENEYSAITGGGADGSATYAVA